MENGTDESQMRLHKTIAVRAFRVVVVMLLLWGATIYLTHFTTAMEAPDQDECVQEEPAEVVEEVVYTESVPYDIIYIEDDTLYEGESVLSQTGEDGVYVYKELVTYVDGEEQSHEIEETAVVAEPVAQVMRIGTVAEGLPIVTGEFIWPVDGSVSSGFGLRSGFGSSNHKGLDIVCSANDPIYAADGGTVIFAGTMSGYGNFVQIDHGNGCVTCYGHCNSIEVSEGDVVRQGDLIALVGMTGTASGYHLHFEIRYDDVQVDPAGYLPEVTTVEELSQ